MSDTVTTFMSGSIGSRHFYRLFSATELSSYSDMPAVVPSKEDLREHIAKKLSALLRDQNISYYRAQQMTGVPDKTIARHADLTGDNTPTLPVLLKYSSAFNVPLSYWFPPDEGVAPAASGADADISGIALCVYLIAVIGKRHYDADNALGEFDDPAYLQQLEPDDVPEIWKELTAPLLEVVDRARRGKSSDQVSAYAFGALREHLAAF